MLDSKGFEKIILWLTIFALIFSALALCFPAVFSFVSRGGGGAEYPIKIFSKDVLNIEISVDEAVWADMVENKMSKPFISCDIKIDGREFKNIGLRPKGNASLTNVSGDRISYRLDFDHYIDNQDCYGLEQMALNNLHADATYMKDYIAYDLMAREGVNAPLHTFAFITINGKPFGVYLAVEIYDKDYLSRVYNDTSVKLYNVKSSGLGEYESAVVDSETAEVIRSYGVEKASGTMGPGGPPPEGGPGGPPPEGFPPGGGPGGEPPQGGPPPGGGPEGQGGGGDLIYTDDSTDSYKSIFANAVSADTNAEDYAKVIRAIKYLNKENVTDEELEKYWDVDSVLRYLAVHAFMVNGDSYTGNMKQNYYLAEQNGKITILPWDYNLSFGTFSMGGPGGGREDGRGGNEAAAAVNHAVDTPVIGVDMAQRPLVSVLLGREEYKEKYHRYLDELTAYVSGDFIDKLETVEKAVYPYVKKETSAFFSPEEQRRAFETLKKFLILRSQSIQAQLSGGIAAETSLQKPEELIAADFSLNEMGTMGQGPGGGPPERGEQGRGNMAPPAGNQGGGPPPPPNGGPGPAGSPQSGNDAAVNIIVTLAAFLVFCTVFAGVKWFRRDY